MNSSNQGQLPTRRELERIADQGEQLTGQVRGYVEQVSSLPPVADPGDVETFLARCAVGRAESHVEAMMEALRGVEGQTTTTPDRTAHKASEPSDSTPVAGRWSKGQRTEVYEGVKLSSSSTYHAVRTFGRDQGEVSICGSVKVGRRTEHLPTRDLEAEGCEACGRCFSDRVIPLPLGQQIEHAKRDMKAAARRVRQLQQERQQENDDE